jgi:hypothetical protein
MKNRLDEVFSMERLRRSWGGAAAPEQGREHEGADGTGGMPDALPSAAAEASYGKLRATIERCFSPDCAAAVEPLLVEIEQLLRQQFPADAPAETARPETAKITLALDQLLNRLEDLLEAFEVGSGRR